MAGSAAGANSSSEPPHEAMTTRVLSTRARLDIPGIQSTRPFGSLTRDAKPVSAGDSAGTVAAMRRASPAEAYAVPGDLVRDHFEARFFATLLRRLIRSPAEVLDLGCGDGLVARLAGPLASRYTGVDLRPPGPRFPGEHVRHDLRQGLGPVGGRPFDLYLATFGLASHLRPSELAALLGQIGRHGRSGALVALEALGLRSLEWPRLWHTSVGAARTIDYTLAGKVEVHPWLPHELASLFREAGIEPLLALDRTLQAGPKLGHIGGWPGLPVLRPALSALVGAPRDPAGIPAALSEPLPPLPAGPAAALHHELAARRRALVLNDPRLEPEALAAAIWSLEPATGGGFGHGLMIVGRIA
jgi:SAM-dependent methyltransferase